MKKQTNPRITLIVLLSICSGIMVKAQNYDEKFAAESGEYISPHSSCHLDHGDVVFDLSQISEWVQNEYLPVSSTAPRAIQTYRLALDFAANAKLDTYYKVMEEVVEIDPNFFMSYAHRAMARISFKEYEKAQSLIDQAVAISAGNLTEAEKIIRQQMVLWQKDSKSSPASLMAELVKAYPQRAEAYEWAGHCASWIDGDKQQALTYYKRAQELRPAFGPGYNMLAYTYMSLEKMEDAKKAFETYLKYSPRQSNAYDSMADYYMAINDYVQAANFYDRAADMGMKSARKRANKARELMGP